MANTIKINPNEIPVRDELLKNMYCTTGGVVRIFPDRKRQSKSDKVGRKAKYKRGYE